ncbi:cyclic nucleotide-binding domain-containing protein [Actinomadura barringtoniae]|uniref:Cyclic nucleotide-binding domain-containing protein n=1 Tax=Actinomadura barringtoniae TaxID=1427535 RepID=A0A939PNE6_9ACTN|nr:cyclic nucleotide-binding domain-containing protein [Actinomadura barringtoniae]MBO2455450.1 cyclic nucleotide-binding domain-containing protein [Actinomadura barringtoniae]
MTRMGGALTAASISGEPFLNGMAFPQLARLATAAHAVAFEPDRQIFAQGGQAEGFWLIRTGAVALDMRIPGQNALTVETLHPRAVLGWSWLFPPHEWKFGARCLQPVTAVEFDGKLVRTLCAADPELGLDLHRRFAKVLIERLQATRIRLLGIYSQATELNWPTP